MNNFYKWNNLLLIAITLCCCSKQTSSNIAEIDESVNFTFDYSDFPNNCVEYNEFVNLNINNAFLYFYSKSCGHCNNIKEYILNFLFESNKEYFLIEFDKKIDICSESYINFSNFTIDDFCIYGTPTLFYIGDSRFTLMLSGSTQILEYIYNPQL